MTRIKTGICALTLAFAASTGAAHADSLSPTFDTFGPLPDATFGGTGIPNDSVAISTTTDAFFGSTVTLGLTAHQRYDNPPLTNDGAGTFTALPGSSTPPGSSEGALWNFAYYIEIADALQAPISAYTFELLYDFDPGENTPESELGRISFDLVGFEQQGGALLEDSQNLMFGFLADDSLPGVDPPAYAAFDPDAAGEYSFGLRAYFDPTLEGTGDLVAESSTQVNVVPTAIPTPVAGLAGLVAFGMLSLRRSRRDQSLATLEA
ncbi:MAG: hypothetical protein WD294_02440 [Phycisphaeraceae bacterium]